MGVRARFILVIVGLSCSVVTIMSGYFIQRHGDDMRDATASKSAVMRDDLRNKGMALARNVALASERAIAVMDFLFVTEVINTTVAHDNEIIYGIVMDNSRKALIHSDPADAGKILDTPAARFAAEQNDVTSQDLVLDGQQIMEVASPIKVGDTRWGTIRFGLSLAKLNHEIEVSEERAVSRTRQGLLATLVAAVLMILVASLAGTLSARSILKPLDILMRGIQRIQVGELDHHVEVEGVPEFVELATAVNRMTRAVRERDAALRENMAELEIALDKAREVSRLKSEFLANISHELRTPLNTIINVPTALLRQYESLLLWHCHRCEANFEPDEQPVPSAVETAARCPDCDVPMELQDSVLCVGDLAEHKHFLVRLQHAGQHLLHVVNDLLDFSKIEAGRMQLYREEVDVRKVITELRDTMEPLAEEKKIEMVYNLPDAPLVMNVDSVKMSQIFINLLGNAIRFTPEKGRIELGAVPYDDNGKESAKFWVTDNGTGIPSDYLEVIFEGFRQVDGSHTRKHGGTGLGLTITRSLVSMHGGRVWAESVEGKGSTFTVIMPCHYAEEKASAVPGLEEGAGGGGDSVIVVDDDEVHLEIARMVLEREGFKVDLVSESGDAFARIKKDLPRAVILDIMMPKVSGITVLKALKADEATRHIPILVATAYHSNRAVVEQLGGVWLPKPWNAAELLERLRSQIGPGQSAAGTTHS
jgi:signal transduction histidine kinase/ActR/RegA family two-component response regulator